MAIDYMSNECGGYTIWYEGQITCKSGDGDCTGALIRICRLRKIQAKLGMRYKVWRLTGQQHTQPNLMPSMSIFFYMPG